MRKALTVMALFALVASSCASSGKDDASADTTAATSAQTAVDDDAASTDSTAGDDQSVGEDESSSAAATTIWLPSSLALDTFVDVALEDSSLDVTTIEEPATYDETADAASAALEQGHLALVPATIGATLVEEQGAVFLGRVFEDEDPELAASQLGVWLIGNAEASGDAAAEQSGFRAGGSDSNITFAAARSLPQQSGPSDGQVVADHLHAEASAFGDSLVQQAEFNAAGDVVESAANAYGARVGGSIAARNVAKFAGPVASVLDFLKTMHDFTVAAMEMIDAESNARISLFDTGMAATAMISDAGTRLAQLRAAVIAGEVSAEDAHELVGTMQNAISRAANVAMETALDLEEAGGETGAAQIQQLRQRRLSEFFDQAGRTIDEIDARPSASEIIVGPAPDRIIHVPGPTTDQSFGAALGILFDVPRRDQSTHSNGQTVVTSEGETDLTGIGQFLWAPADGGPGLGELLPCGQMGDAHTLCGGREYFGEFTVAVARLDGMIDFNSERIYQYAFVFDRDSDPGNNYTAGGAYPYDTWDGSDIRYELAVGNGSYAMNVTEGPNFANVNSGAVFHVEGNTIMAVIPRDEVGGGPTDPLVPMRATTFWHLGDFGQGPDQAFNIDLFPVVHEPFWIPENVVRLTGPPGGFGDPRPIEPEQFDMFEQYRQGVSAGFAGFTPVEITPEDISAVADIDECFANQYFSENSGALVTDREQYIYDGVSIQVKYEAHESDSAARGVFGFSSSPVSVNCRGALISSVGVELSSVDRTVSEDTLTVDRYEFNPGDMVQFLNVYSGYMDSTFVRVNTTGPANPELDAMIIDSLTP